MCARVHFSEQGKALGDVAQFAEAKVARAEPTFKLRVDAQIPAQHPVLPESECHGTHGTSV